MVNDSQLGDGSWVCGAREDGMNRIISHLMKNRVRTTGGTQPSSCGDEVLRGPWSRKMSGPEQRDGEAG